MFGSQPFLTSAPQADRAWQVPQQPGMAPLAQLLDEARQTNALLRSILGAVLKDGSPDRPDPVADPAADLSFNPLALIERVEWLERQVAELKERR